MKRISTWCLVFWGTALLSVMGVQAQNKKLVTGQAVDKINNTPVRMASINNITIGQTAISRANGTFELEVAAGHLIAYSANGYYADTITLTATSYIEGSILLLLRPLPSTLTDVTIVGNYNQYQIDSLERRKSFLQDVGENPMPVVSRANDLNFGVGVNLDRWSKKQKRDRKARSIYDIMEEDAYVNFRWNEAFVSQYTSYRNDELIDFMWKNRPPYQWLRKNPDDESLVYYINSSLKKEKRDKKSD